MMPLSPQVSLVIISDRSCSIFTLGNGQEKRRVKRFLIFAAEHCRAVLHSVRLAGHFRASASS